MLDNFNLSLLKRSKKENDSLMEAILLFQEEHPEYDYEDIVGLLHPIILDKLKTEVYMKGYIPSKKIKHNLESFFS